MTGFYIYNFAVLAAACGALTWYQFSLSGKNIVKNNVNKRVVVPTAKNEASNFTKLFLIVYMLVMGADWLQVR